MKDRTCDDGEDQPSCVEEGEDNRHGDDSGEEVQGIPGER